MKKKFVPILAAGALIVVIICFMLLGSIIEKYTPSKEHMNLSDYYNLSGEQDVALILDNQILDAKGKLLNGTVYLDYETVCSYLNDRFYWDHNENKLLYTTATDLISADADSTSYYVTKDSHSLDHPIVKADAQTAYIAIDFLKLYSDFSYEVLDSPNRVILTTAWGDYTTAPAKQKITAPSKRRHQESDPRRYWQKHGSYRFRKQEIPGQKYPLQKESSDISNQKHLAQHPQKR